MNKLHVLSSKATDSIDRTLWKLMSFFGADASMLECSNFLENTAEFTRQASLFGLSLHADAFAALCDRDDLYKCLQRVLLSGGNIFLYGFSGKISAKTLELLTGERVQAIENASYSECGHLPLGGKRFSKQLAGADFPRGNSAGKSHDVFRIGHGLDPNNDVIPLITLSGEPSFLCWRSGKGHVFLSTTASIPDPDEYVANEEAIHSFYDSILPVLIFLRFACREFCWHGGYQGARIIIDDPVLRRKYGCLDFSRLFESLKQHNYAASIAYIPWNHLRTSQRNVSFFNVPGQQLTLCIHGCDHTNNEYGTLEERILLHKSQLAFERMRKHQRRTGMDFEPIMVFPQGRFSACSLRALRSSGFLAAINTTRFPVDDDGRSVSLGDLLLPALSGAHGVPVFGRHYPRTLFPFLFDLFMGRPSFIVEHHDFFSKGFPILESLIDQLNACEPELSWGRLQETLERSCWQRAISSTHWEVRFFTDRFQLTNRSDKRLSYRLWKEERDEGAEAAVSLGGHSKPLERLGDTLQIEIAVDPGQTVRVQVQPAAPLSRPFSNGGSLYASKVFFRRVLSEFRDEVLTKHPAFLASAKGLVRLLKASSDSTPRSSHHISP
jgi:hypothetical protein